MKVTFYGVRGSIPTSSEKTIKYGGHTSCLYAEVDNKVLVFDAGTGIRKLGGDLIQDQRDIYLFFSHYHWDHIQGFPFFKPAYQCGRTIYLLAAYLPAKNAKAVLDQMVDPHFPIPGDQIQAKVRVMPMDDDNNLILENTKITTRALNHSGGGAAYRVETSQGSFAYVTDNELYPPNAVNTTWEQWVDFLQGVDVLIHDAMYLDKELSRIHGWGHSLVSQVLQLAKEAKVANLVLFHHDPDRTDKQLEKILAESQQWMEKEYADCKVTLAKEGDTYHISASGVELKSS
ncbi:MAG: MBL fold metallo-hydrolase [Aquificaceae bacterium]|nr:MAG: MBL fold metallo-hydrolase [Aquificaceae bacterium]